MDFRVLVAQQVYKTAADVSVGVGAFAFISWANVNEAIKAAVGVSTLVYFVYRCVKLHVEIRTARAGGAKGGKPLQDADP